MYLGEFEDEEGEKNLNMLSLMINYIASWRWIGRKEYL